MLTAASVWWSTAVSLFSEPFPAFLLGLAVGLCLVTIKYKI